jgi:hypothetical protein
MRHIIALFLASALLCFSAVARSQRASSATATSRSQSENQASAVSAPDCNTVPSSTHAAAKVEISTLEATASQAGRTGAIPPLDEIPAAVAPPRDLEFLTKKQSALAQCILAIDASASAPDLQGACSGELLLNFEMRHDGEPERDIPIGRLAGTSAFFYESGMTIDADGAPNAYHPDNTGLDDLANAGAPGRWEGLAKDADGEPYIQGPDDPFPGYYVSATALADRTKPPNDPTRYVDASRIPFIVLPGGMARQIGARPGDFAAVFNQRNGNSSFAIFGDVGPFDRIGEGSVALAENLGIRSDARNGGARRGILYLVFPGSGNGRPRTIEEINEEGQKLLQAWEAAVASSACAVQLPTIPREGNEATN